MGAETKGRHFVRLQPTAFVPPPASAATVLDPKLRVPTCPADWNFLRSFENMFRITDLASWVLIQKKISGNAIRHV